MTNHIVLHTTIHIMSQSFDVYYRTANFQICPAHFVCDYNGDDQLVYWFDGWLDNTRKTHEIFCPITFPSQ